MADLPEFIATTASHLIDEGRAITLKFDRTGDTTATLSWTLPPKINLYNGILLLISPQEMNLSNQPTDGVMYTASADLSLPADRIGLANVVGAFYDDVTTTSIEITGLMKDRTYYCSAHMATDVRQYNTRGVKSYPENVRGDAYAGDIPHNDGPPLNPYIGQVYFDISTCVVQLWNGTSWMPASKNTVATGTINPTNSPSALPIGTIASTGVSSASYALQIGDFFYNTALKTLFTWDGGQWNKVQLQEDGLPMYDKTGIGTDGSYDERLDLIDILKKQLGHPMVCVELAEDHYNIAIDNALQELRHRSDIPYYRQFFFMGLKAMQSVYYLNDPALGTNKIVDIIKINRLSGLGFVTSGESGLYTQQMIRDMFMPGTGGGNIDLVSIHLISQLSETFSLLFAGDIDFNYREATREMTIYKKMYKDERVLIECSMEKTEQEILQDRWTTQWIQGWALSECREMLAMVRSKFGSLPGAGGGISLNGDALLSQANEEKTELLRQLMDSEVGNNGSNFGNYSFLMGSLMAFTIIPYFLLGSFSTISNMI